MDGFLNAFDPNRNGFNDAMDPNRNGVADFFKNDVKSFVTNDVGGFFKGTIGPIANDLIHTVSQGVLLPFQFMNKMMSTGMSVLDGNGLYMFIGIIAIVGIGGSIIYYKFTRK